MVSIATQDPDKRVIEPSEPRTVMECVNLRISACMAHQSDLIDAIYCAHLLAICKTSKNTLETTIQAGKEQSKKVRCWNVLNAPLNEVLDLAWRFTRTFWNEFEGETARLT